MAFNPAGVILCRRCDCIKCEWEQEPYIEDPKDKLVRLVGQGINSLWKTGAKAEGNDLNERLDKLLDEAGK